MNTIYKDRIFAFLDILGFSAAINKTVKNGNEVYSEIEKIKSLTQSFQYDIKQNKNRQDDFKIKSKIINRFSDSIVISYSPDDPVGIKEILVDISNYQLTALLFGFLLRGAVVYDKLYHIDTDMFGPAVIKAYELEKNMAFFPRIILDTSIIHKYFEKEDNINLSTWRTDSIVTKDYDGQYFLDYLFSILPSDDDIDVIAKVKNIFRNNLTKIIKNMKKIESYSVKSKYLWLNEKYYGYLNEIKKSRGL